MRGFVRFFSIGTYSIFISFLYEFFNQTESFKYMFGLMKRPYFLSLCNESIFIIVHDYWINNVRNVLSFSCRICYSFLFKTLPTHIIIIHTKNYCHQYLIKTSIWITMNYWLVSFIDYKDIFNYSLST
jgi:hypothetical protein